MKYPYAHKTCDAVFSQFKFLRWFVCVLAAVACAAAIFASVSDRDLKSAIEVTVKTLLFCLGWWVSCTLVMAIAAGMHACVTAARAQVGEMVDADTDCKRVERTRQPEQAAIYRGPMPATPVPARTESPLGQLPGESLEAWAKRTEQAELAAFKARTKST